MRFICFISISITVLVTGCGYMNNPLRRETHRLQRGRIIDTSSFVYDLPYPKGTSRTLVQGYFTQFTHKRRAALDFKMPIGSPVCAAREGVVVRTKEDGDQGGIRKSNRPHANYVVIQHADSSRAGYWHLKKESVLVNVGDTVKKGQLIAYSGNTGYTYFPHLHFIVWTFDRNGRFKQMPTRFHTKKGARYLRAIRRYRNPPE
ncbi:M23 family metallopeptidase [Niabella beijingensis]|uniref:M23 family metallopeptidase n=1 Tax=Niabella beijingensis TaxID=2872700 RepID=UPI0023E43213|nr:M23 family metallopeptidase [Niabella beijingensis]MBZ4189690.1 M23 family metallopeptidase [Niabella beijingensis]